MILLPRRQSSRGEKKTDSHGVLSPSRTPHIHLVESRVVSYIQGDLTSPFSKTRKKDTNLSKIYTHQIWLSAQNLFKILMIYYFTLEVMHGSLAPRTILSSPTRSMGLQHTLPIPSKSHHPSLCQRQPCKCTVLLMIHPSFMAQCIKQDMNTSLQLIFHLNLHLKHENGCQLLTPRNEMLCSALHTPRTSHQDLVRCFYKDPDSCNECFQPGRLPQSAKFS